ncbi:Uncharacterised protein [Mycobacteroides abscessus subsp. abscessus]|nr:Uncharacterised protein [Mycobacteroides abscessus subsp. abscessus]
MDGALNPEVVSARTPCGTRELSPHGRYHSQVITSDLGSEVMPLPTSSLDRRASSRSYKPLATKRVKSTSLGHQTYPMPNR